MAPAVAIPHIIARKRLNLNSFLATFISLSPSEPNSAYDKCKCKCCCEHEQVKGGHIEYNISKGYDSD
jgi:hypothetical protein